MTLVLYSKGTKIDINPPTAVRAGWRVGEIEQVGQNDQRKIKFGDIVNGENHTRCVWIDIRLNASRIAKFGSMTDYTGLRMIDLLGDKEKEQYKKMNLRYQCRVSDIHYMN